MTERGCGSFAARFGRRGGLMLCFVIVLLGLFVLACGQPARPHEELDTDVVRVVTWNVHKCEAGVDAIANELRHLNPDVVCLQEITEPIGGASNENQARQIAERLHMYAYSFGARLDDGRSQCVAILSRVPLAEAEPLDAGTGRNYGVTAVVGWRGCRLRVVSIHLAGTYRANWRHIVQTSHERVQESADLARRIREWATPIVVAGDLNTLPGSTVRQRLAERLAAAPLKGATFPSNRPIIQLDQVFVSSDLAVRRAEIGDSQASDHRPVVVGVGASEK